MIKKILIGIGILGFLFGVLIFYGVYQDLKQESILEQEIVRLSNKDMIQDNYNVSIKTSGEYSYVESAIKNYYKELSNHVKSIYYYMSDDELFNIMTISNFEKDGPLFNNSYQKIDVAKNKINDSIDKISFLCEKENIDSFLDKDKVSDYYVRYYKKLMYSEKDLKSLRDTKEEMEKTSNKLNTYFDKVKGMLDILKNNDGHWFVRDGQLYFDQSSLVDQYNGLYGDLKSFVKDNFDRVSDTIVSDGNSSI